MMPIIHPPHPKRGRRPTFAAAHLVFEQPPIVVTECQLSPSHESSPVRRRARAGRHK
jgi:hypothetical protein